MLLFITISCKRIEVQNFSEPEIVDIMTDFQIAEASLYLESNLEFRDSIYKEMHRQILKKHGLSESSFEELQALLKTDLALHRRLLEKLRDSLSKMEEFEDLSN